jgi:amidase
MKRNLLILSSLIVAFTLRADSVPTEFNENTVIQLQRMMTKGEITSEQLTRYYIARIAALDQSGPNVNSVIELNPDAIAMAQNADQMRKQGKVLGPLHGIPVLLKDNIDTGDKMQTSAGSFALVGTPAQQDSTVAANLRAGGAVILGKTNLSEWANFRSFESISGWSGRGGQTNNPYGINRNPCGSSAGSGAAASANFVAVSLGSETDGSIVCPGNANGVAAIKPTVGLVSRAGVVPISHTQDTVGPHGRTVADAAVALGVIQSRTFDGRDPATGGVPLGWQGTGKTRPTNIPTDYTKFLNANGLNGARIGVTRVGLTGFTNVTTPQRVLDAFEAAITEIQNAGATVIDLDAQGVNLPVDGNSEFFVLLYDFKGDVANYFATRVGVPVAGGDLQTAIDFNNAHADIEMPFFNQDIFDFAETITLDPNFVDPNFGETYNQALAAGHNLGVALDAALAQYHLDAIVSATDNPAWTTDLLYGDHFVFGTSSYAAPEGYPIVQVPAGIVDGLPLGISFFGTAFSEPTLIKLASGFEAVTHVRKQNLPTFAPYTPFNNIQGTSPTKKSSTSNATRTKQNAKQTPHNM